MPEPTVRDADPTADADAVWGILEPVFRRGDTYAVDVDVAREDGLAFWFDHARVRVAVADGHVRGTYYLDRNQGGGGSHVANCGYAVHPDARGLGLGRAMCADSLEQARRAGFTAMQFNFVVSTNEDAIRLWEAMGFEVVGTIPGGFTHPERGHVDALVMHRHL
jgi:ribosomal protein S18 acetylase RimI-like enzyme